MKEKWHGGFAWPACNLLIVLPTVVRGNTVKEITAQRSFCLENQSVYLPNSKRATNNVLLVHWGAAKDGRGELGVGSQTSVSALLLPHSASASKLLWLKSHTFLFLSWYGN